MMIVIGQAERMEHFRKDRATVQDKTCPEPGHDTTVYYRLEDTPEDLMFKCAPVLHYVPSAKDGHTFKISFDSRGVTGVVTDGEMEFKDAGYWDSDVNLGPRTVEIRAWNLRDALQKAARLPLNDWFPEEAEEAKTMAEPQVIGALVKASCVHDDTRYIWRRDQHGNWYPVDAPKATYADDWDSLVNPEPHTPDEPFWDGQHGHAGDTRPVP